MTPQEFNQLDFAAQDHMLFEKATEIFGIIEQWYDVRLYCLEDFFVTYSMPKDHEADLMHALETEAEIAPYKELISVFVIKN